MTWRKVTNEQLSIWVDRIDEINAGLKKITQPGQNAAPSRSTPGATHHLAPPPTNDQGVLWCDWLAYIQDFSETWPGN